MQLSLYQCDELKSKVLEGDRLLRVLWYNIRGLGDALFHKQFMPLPGNFLMKAQISDFLLLFHNRSKPI